MISISKHLQFIFFAAHPNASFVRRILLHGSIRIKWNAGNCKFADIFEFTYTTISFISKKYVHLPFYVVFVD